MRLLLILPLAALLAIGCNRQDTSGQKGAPPGKDSKGGAQDQKGLQGTWKVVSIGGNGKTMPPEQTGDMKVTITGQQYTTTKGGKVIEQATITTDPSKQPKTIDLTVTQGEAKGKTGLGIYARPSIRLMYGAQYSTMHAAFGNGFSTSNDQFDQFPVGPERHWHHLISIESEGWF